MKTLTPLIRLLFIIASITCAIPYNSQAHPHAFVNTYFKVVFNETGIDGIRVYWVFDEMYSAMTGPEFDLDGDGTFNDAESRELVELGKESLPAFSYFTHIEVDGKPYPVTTVQDFSIRFEEGTLYYEFFVECKIEADTRKHQLKISPYDPDFFLAMLFPEEGAVLLEKDAPFTVNTEIGEDPDTLIYFDMIHPTMLTLEFERKS